MLQKKITHRAIEIELAKIREYEFKYFLTPDWDFGQEIAEDKDIRRWLRLINKIIRGLTKNNK